MKEENPGGRRGRWYGSYCRASFEPERQGMQAGAAGTWAPAVPPRYDDQRG